MLRVARAVEHSLSSTVAPDLAQDRVDKIKTLRPFPDRIGAMALHRLITAQPELARKAINLMLIPRHLRYISSGADSGVFQRDDQVVKIIRSSVPLSEEEKVAKAQQRTEEFERLHEFMTPFMLSEKTVVDTHPLNPDWRVVQTLQPYCEFEPLGIFSIDDTQVNIGNVYEATKAHAGIEDALTDFVQGSERYHDETGLYPDTNGTNNLVLSGASTPELTLLDTGPIGPNHPAVQVVIAGQLESLAGALREIA